MRILIIALFLLVGCSEQPAGYVPTHEEYKNQNICKGKLKKEILKRYDTCMEHQYKLHWLNQKTNTTEFCSKQSLEFVCPMGSLEGLK